MVILPDDLEVEVGDEAVIIGKQQNDEIIVDEIAQKIGTINYEIVCMLSKRLPRIYI
jgi:alanine racemase